MASRRFTSQINEILCMGIFHNLMVLVRQMHEADILSDFLRPPESAPLTVRPKQVTEPSLFLSRPAGTTSVPISVLRGQFWNKLAGSHEGVRASRPGPNPMREESFWYVRDATGRTPALAQPRFVGHSEPG